jgi:DNA-binding SARP family transcriptional activator
MLADAAVIHPGLNAAGAERRPTNAVRLRLLGAFQLTIAGESVPLPMNGQRVLAFLALEGRLLLRSFVAGSLWMDVTDDRAGASLRSALWRLNRQRRLVDADGQRLQLGPQIVVDVDAAVDEAQSLLDPAGDDCPSPRTMLLRQDLLPDWYDDWVTLDRERFRQLRMHALEPLCDRLTGARRFGEAIEAGLEAARVEPLRESAQRAIIRVHLAEGNRSEALQHYLSYRKMLHDELGLEPSPEMSALIASLTSS